MTTTIWIDTDENAVILSRDDGERVDDIEIKAFVEPKAAYRFAVDLETFMRAWGVDVELESER